MEKEIQNPVLKTKKESVVNVSCGHPNKCFAFMRPIGFEKNHHGTSFITFQCPECNKKVTVSIAPINYDK